jgi:hypothetical protein
MKRFIIGASIALALASSSILVAAPASAAVDFSISLGNAAYGYSDGYWDRDHHWHTWRNRQESAYFRAHNGDHYVATRHDRGAHMKDKGWNEDHYWDKH